MVAAVGIDYAELERELCRIPEVNAARIVTDGDDLPVEVHILASPEKHAKQVVRDVQSVAMASFGLDIDRRVISVVQLEGLVGSSESAEAGEKAIDPDARPDPGVGSDEARIMVDDVRIHRADVQCVAHVTLHRGEERAGGRAEGVGATSATLRLVAQATMLALRQLEPAANRADVETASVVRLGERQVALASVVLVVPPYEEVVTGSAVVRSAGEPDAIARAVLDATNRRLTQLR
jgi:hypothetical protein